MKKLFSRLFLCMVLSTACFSQQKAKQKTHPPAPIIEQKPEPEVVPPYEGNLLKFAETLGSLSLLSSICSSDNSTNSETWRLKAKELLDAEGTSENRKRRFVASFNQGFNSYYEVYRVCTPNAELAKERLLSEGARLGRDLSSRFGN